MTLNEDSIKLDQVKRNFSRHAAEYDRYAMVQKAVAEKLLDRLSIAPVCGEVLEVGCGTGMLSRPFNQKYPDASLVLSDIAHGMSCHVAGEFSKQLVVDADAAALPFSSESFDLVISSSVYQWVDHLPQAFSELQRVLRPGGHIALALFGERTLFELRKSHGKALRNGSSHGQGFPDCTQIISALEDRFEIKFLESAEEIEWHRDVPHLLRSLKAIGAQNASRQRPAGLASRKVMQRMYDCYIKEFSVDGMIPATYEVLYLLAHRR